MKPQELLKKKPEELTRAERTTLEIYVNFNPKLTGEERMEIREKYNIGQVEKDLITKYRWYR